MIAGNVAEDEHPTVRLVGRASNDLHVRGGQACMEGIEVVDLQEEANATSR